MLAFLSTQQKKNIQIAIDNVFITEYMPSAPDEYVKVYLLGYSLACSGDDNNSLATICSALALSAGDVKAAFSYWAAEGLVSLTDEEPFTVEYLPVSYAMRPVRKFSKTKYEDFNNQLHAILPNRQILPAEYNEYYSVIEDCHFEPSAMLAIIAYCVRLKGEDISYRYILTVARNLASKNLLTFDRVNEELSQYDAYSADTDKISKALHSRKAPDHEDRNLLVKWTKNYGFTLDAIVEIAKKHVKKGDFAKLDRALTKYYENHLFTLSEVDEYVKNRDSHYELCRAINRIIGVYYEQLDYIVETYLSKWLSMGFDGETLKSIAEYCFKRSVKTLDGMNGVVEKFYREGAVTADAIGQYVSRAVATDNEIRRILEEAGISRAVTSRDRDSYRTWTYSWNRNLDLILYAASLSRGAGNPIAYVNSLLSTWMSKGIDTVEQAKKEGSGGASAKQAPESRVEKSYTSAQLNAMFEHLSYEDL